MDLLFVSRRIFFLGIAIIIGLVLIFLMGLFITPDSGNEFEIYGIISVFICVGLCFLSFFLRKSLLKKINGENYMKVYFNAHVLPFALCDLGGLMAITTNIFINRNVLLALGGLVIAILYILLNFPKTNDIPEMNLQ